jgi:glyoxylase-like metal-dependent hydrolase (beta-lactamase superfamily II)/predicted ester cyclase
MTAREVRAVAERYFAALDAHDLDAAVACWAPGARDRLVGQADLIAPGGIRAFFGDLFTAIPDARLEVHQVTADEEHATVRWTLRGTFATGDVLGHAATGGAVAIEGLDELAIADGVITDNHAFVDGMGFARQIGLLPAAGTKADARLTKAANARTRAGRALSGAGAEEVAEGVWRVRGGLPLREMNAYLVRDGEGVLAFDTGVASMGAALRAAAASLGGLTRVVLGHPHPDHRGSAPALGADVLCHEADRAIAEGDGGMATLRFDRLQPHARPAYKRLLPRWDGGPVAIAQTLREGDEVAGFEVVHLPGHTAGMIALWRERDRVALTSDAFYTLDVETTMHGPPRVPHDAFNLDPEQARVSLRKLAALRPAVAWPGHAAPATGDVHDQLLRAADA